MINFTIKSFILGLFATFIVVNHCYAQTYIPVPVSGFNHDLIAEGFGGVNRAASTTTTTFDNVNVGGDNVMYSKDFRGNNNPNNLPPFGLPVDRVINSVNLIGANYLLAPYVGNNALVLKSNGSSGTLVLGTPGVFSKIAILGSSAEGASSFNVKLNFSDGTNTSSSINVPDWYFGSNFAIKGFGRVTRTQIGTQIPDFFTGDTENPRLYDNQITLAAPFNSKILTSITFTKTSTIGNTAILAINGITPVNAPSAPVATAATNINSSSFTANWNATAGATAYYLDVSTTSNFTSILPSYNNRNIGNVLNFSITGISNTQNYFYRVRAANASGVSPSSNTINVINVQCPPSDVNVSTQAQIDNFKLSYPTCTIINGNLNITNGVDITNVNGFSNILEIANQLNIVNNELLNDLSGFSNLNKVTSNFWIAGNKTLKQIKEFTKLTFAGQLYFGSNDQLVEISGFQKLVALPDLTIENNNALTLINFNSNINLTDRFMTFKNNPNLQKIQSIGIKLWVSNTVTFENNPNLTNLTAFNNISLIGELIIKNNANLTNLNSFAKVANLNGSIQLINNSKLSDITGLSNVLPGSIKGSGLIITNNPILTLCNLPNFCTYLQGSGARSITGNLGNCLNEQAVLNICNAISAPVALAATNISTTEFTANWQAVNGATKYFIDATPDPNFLTLPVNNFDVGSSLSLTFPGLTPNSTYYYRVRANNGVSTSPNSNVITVTTSNAAPAAPTATAATNITSTSFTANWNFIGNATEYFIDVSTNSNFSSFVMGYNNLSADNLQSINITGLIPNSNYYYRVRASNLSGISPNSNTIMVSTFEQPCFINIPDPNFKTYLLGNNSINTNGDTYIQCAEAEAFSGSIICPSKSISDLTGIEAFINITSLDCGGNQLTTLNLSKNTKLKTIAAALNQLSYLVVDNCLTLERLYCESNKLTNINVNANTNLTTLSCHTNSIVALNLANNTLLKELLCSDNKLTSLNIKNNNNVVINKMFAQNNPDLTCIQVDNASFSSTNWTGANFAFDPQHQFNENCDIVNDGEYCDNAINLNNLFGKPVNEPQSSITYSTEGYNNLNDPAFGHDCIWEGTKNTIWFTFIGDGNQYRIRSNYCGNQGNPAAALYAGDCNNLEAIACSLDIWGGDENSDFNFHFDLLTVTGKQYFFFVSSPAFPNDFGDFCLEITNITEHICDIVIPDVNFKNYLIGNFIINTNEDDEIQCSEAESFTGIIDCRNLQIKDLTGIEAFINLTALDCSNNQIQNINVSKNTTLLSLNCANNQINHLNIQQNNQLIELFCFQNQLNELKVDMNLNLQKLGCNNNEIGLLNISKNTSLTHLWCYENSLFSLNLANGINVEMELIEAGNNPDLTCIKVDNEDYSNTNWKASPFQFDAQHVFREECDACDDWREQLNAKFLVSATACNGDEIHVIDFSNILENQYAQFIWDFGNGKTSTDRDPIIVYDATGNYTITVVVSGDNCESFEMKKNIVILGCRKNEALDINHGKLYPSPNDGNIQFIINLQDKSPIVLQAYNSNGKLIKIVEFAEAQFFNNHFQLEEPGFYFIEVLHKFGIIKLKTIVLK